ncbi:hypothetical protein L0B53_03070 [Vibrio sp. SS-MA-C1-2]|uniref:hypothetical protein n=1 Tax=Vibrio sp. SS-MA-C1-2 TaxID=2908646 RepID=UPI001F1874A9|nr:hypothetical protein [Vibrio sp. SS-MA-C1-2]UJF16938.1 hypothetical protein L0B53_03070 [Vibrio sp. SS-MA-C1-2]
MNFINKLIESIKNFFNSLTNKEKVAEEQQPPTPESTEQDATLAQKAEAAAVKEEAQQQEQSLKGTIEESVDQQPTEAPETESEVKR